MSEASTAVEERIEGVDKPLVRTFREYGMPRVHWFVAAVAMNFLARMSSLVPPLVLGTAIDSVFNDTGAYSLPLVPNAWLPSDPEAQFWFSVALIVGSFVATAVFTWGQGITSDIFAHRSLHAVRVDAFRKMQSLDMTFFDAQETGEALSILNNDASNLERFLDDALKNGVRLIVMVLAIAAILVSLNWQLALVTLVGVPLMAIFTIWFSREVSPRYDAVRSSIGDLNNRLENSLGGMQLVKTSNTESFETDRVAEASWNFYSTNISVLKLVFVYQPGMRLLAGMAFVATFVVGGLWLFSGPPLFFTGTLSTGEFVVFIFMTQRFINPLAQISNIIDWFQNARASGKRVFGLMDTEIRIKDAPDATELGEVDGHVEYEDVSFGYESEDEYVLEDVSLTAESGDTVAFVGPTGAGKSTALKLLMRLYDVDEGVVRVDGHDVRDVTLASLRESIGYVSQESYLFDGTIAENIRYGRFDADREEIIEAAKAAEAHQFIEELPDGYDTRVGERGVLLSGGQRQRLSIARTVLQDPEILILDEATSAVDTETEVLIQRSLDRLAADRTTFVIAHRLSTVTDAEQIIVLEDGQVAERGTHDELLEEDGLYANLWGIQAGEIDDLPDEFVERHATEDAGTS